MAVIKVSHDKLSKFRLKVNSIDDTGLIFLWDLFFVGVNSYLLVSSADNLCKQFGSRSSRTEGRSDLGPNCLTL